MGAMEHGGRENGETDRNDKAESELTNTMHRAASVEDLFAPLWGLNVHAGGEPTSSSASASRLLADRDSTQARTASTADVVDASGTRRAAPQADAFASPPSSARKIDASSGQASVSGNSKGASGGGPPKSPLHRSRASVSNSAAGPGSGLEAKGQGIRGASREQSNTGVAGIGEEGNSSLPFGVHGELESVDVKPSLVSLDLHPSSTGGAKGSLSTWKSSSSGGGSEAALPPSQSTSDDDQANGPGLDERKQKRMLSNRESARRSRLRKQQHLDELRAQVAQLRVENTDIMARYGLASQRYSQITGENHVLRAHATDLSRKLQHIHHIVATQHPNGLSALGIQPGHLDSFASGHLSPYFQPLIPDLLP